MDRTEENSERMIVSMSPKSYSYGCPNSTSSVRAAFLVGTMRRAVSALNTCYSLWIFRAAYSCSSSPTKSFEFGLLTQVFEMGIDLEERPARESGIDAAFQPRHRLVRFAQYGINAGDLIIGVVSMAEGARRIERPADTLDRSVASGCAGRAAYLAG